MAVGHKTGGRIAGTPNKATAEVHALATEHGPGAIAELARLSTEAVNETARIAACNAILKRAYGDSNSVPIEIDLPDTSTPAGVVRALAAIVQAVSQGEMSPEAGRDLSTLLESQRKAIEIVDIEERLKRLEASQERRSA